MDFTLSGHDEEGRKLESPAIRVMQNKRLSLKSFPSLWLRLLSFQYGPLGQNQAYYLLSRLLGSFIGDNLCVWSVDFETKNFYEMFYLY